ncbi:unnamed protein product [Pylaiella littoralis]
MRTVIVAVVSFAIIGDGFIRGASSFSLPSSFTERGGNYFSCSRLKQWLGTRRLLDNGYCCYSLNERGKHQHSTEEQCAASRGYDCGRKNTRSRGRRSTGATASPTTLYASSTASSPALSSAELPSLGGLPSADTIPVQQGSSSPPSSTHGGVGRRSRRGKYPVIELYRRDIDDMVTDSVSSTIDDGRGDENDLGDGCRTGSAGASPRPQRDESDDDGDAAAAAVRRGPLTAMQHLTSKLRLGPEQADLMLESFPALADVHPDKLDLPAKLLFLRHTIGGDGATVAVSFPQFFGHPLERHVAPRHAFLVASGRPSGERLLERNCRGLRRMLELPANRFVAEMVPRREMSDYRRFEQAFLRGPFDAARKGDAETLRLLRSHGWDCWEVDRRGRTALFWAAGGGSIEACVALVEGEGGLKPQDAGGDGSTPLHWAAAGVEIQRFGTGGHVNVCRWLVYSGADPRAVTSEGNTVVMWAAWAGSFDTTRWAVEEAGADLGAANANGCTVAHWASSGGDEAVCRYLHSKGVDFTRRNNGGNDPLNHAVAYGRRDIAAWLLEEGQTGASAPLRDENQTGELGDGDAHGVTETKAGRRRRRRRDDPQLLDLARLTGDEKMQAFLLEGRK